MAEDGVPTGHANREVSRGGGCLLLLWGLSEPRLHREDHGHPAANQWVIWQKQAEQHTSRSSYSRRAMSVLQANLDKNAVLVPGENLDIISAVQRRRRGWYIQQPWAACWPLCLGTGVSILQPHTYRRSVTYSTCRHLTCPWPAQRRARL